MSKFITGDAGLTAEAKQLALDLCSAAGKVLSILLSSRPMNTPHQGEVEATRQAIWSGADVDQLDREGKSPLIHASRCAHPQRIQSCCEGGCAATERWR